ncbi:CD1871A family CXXC motif-containing protein, partial [Treponema pedis]
MAAAIVIVLSLGMMLFGIYRGEVSVVLKKAINICMECIG